MPYHRTLSRSGLAALLVALSAGAASAQTDSAPLEIIATVRSDCSVQSGTLDFGEYVRGQKTARDAQVGIQLLNCSVGTITIEIDGGSSGVVASRRMLNGGSQLPYQLYRSSLRSDAVIFGQGAQAEVLNVLVAGNNQFNVYGRIPSGLEVPAGSYADTVNVTINF
jgi:spore coat protein U-like protein